MAFQTCGATSSSLPYNSFQKSKICSYKPIAYFQNRKCVVKDSTDFNQLRFCVSKTGTTFSSLAVQHRRWCSEFAVYSLGSDEKISSSMKESEVSKEDEIPPGCSRYTVQLSKPLGLVLEETKEGTIVVAEITPGGNADVAGVIQPGDMLIATSGMTRIGKEQMYGETVVRSGETFVRLQTQGESFDTVLAAIGSIPGNMKVTLDFQRC